MADEKNLDDRHAAWQEEAARSQQADAVFLAGYEERQKFLAAFAAGLKPMGIDLDAMTAAAREAFAKDADAALGQKE